MSAASNAIGDLVDGYMNKITERLRSPELDFSLSRTRQGYLLASKLSGPPRRRFYDFVINSAGGVGMAPKTLENFINDASLISREHFKNDFGLATKTFCGFTVVPVVVSNTPYTQDVIDYVSNHADHDKTIHKQPILLQINMRDAQPFDVKIFGLGADSKYSLINRVLDINAPIQRPFWHPMRWKIASAAFISAGAYLSIQPILNNQNVIRGGGLTLLALGILYGFFALDD